MADDKWGAVTPSEGVTKNRYGCIDFSTYTHEILHRRNGPPGSHSRRSHTYREQDERWRATDGRTHLNGRASSWKNDAYGQSGTTRHNGRKRRARGNGGGGDGGSGGVGGKTESISRRGRPNGTTTDDGGAWPGSGLATNRPGLGGRRQATNGRRRCARKTATTGSSAVGRNGRKRTRTKTGNRCPLRV